ncbi:Bcr/CflA family efflux MFS transporter [Salmonella enterica subsp. enterica]|nr:Bcr/CflA family efflux MFS transporter [Salmonella enterica subsp. enterica]EEA7878450.1 Bcr/CflA family efflux MFS transporter [Salmonella enterica subsp. enterica]
MTTRQHSSFAIVFILGLLAMLMPLSIDMYLPALPVISAQFGVPAGSAQMTLSTYILGFALGQLIYGPMADSLGRKPVILGGTLVFAAAAVACALAQTIDQLIVMRFFHGLAAAAASVVINALMRDIYPKEEFSRMMSFVMLVTTIAPLMAPIVGGCVSMVSSNAMAVILDEFPHMAGTASSLAGTFRFGIGAIVGALLSLATFTSAWPMIWSIALCAACSILFYLYASRPKKR